MQLEITLNAGPGEDARDLGYLLHKNPSKAHVRPAAGGKACVFFREVSEERATAVLALEVDPIALVRGKSDQAQGLLTQYVNDRAFAASSFLAVAIGKALGQSLAGKSKERQALADRALDFEFRVTPLGVAGDLSLIEKLFAPLGYDIGAQRIEPRLDPGERPYVDLRLKARVKLEDALNHLYVLIPVLDHAKHWFINRDEVENLLAKGEGWLASHPEKETIARRALKNRPTLAARAIARLREQEAEALPEDEDDETARDAAKEAKEEALEKPLRLHDLRLDAVRDQIMSRRVHSVLDLGCGEGRLIARLIKERGVDRIVGVDGSTAALERAARKLRLDRSGEKLRERVTLMQGALTYADRRWEGFDAAALVEVIEHIDPWRLSAFERSLFGVAQPRLAIVTTPNVEYNALFDGIAPGDRRHPDHRFEWTRAEFQSWVERVCAEHGYAAETAPLGPEDAQHGAPSQMAVFERAEAA